MCVVLVFYRRIKEREKRKMRGSVNIMSDGMIRYGFFHVTG
jgi:hypothetical protein